MGRTGVVAGLGVVVAATASVGPFRPSRPAPDPGFALGLADSARVARHRGPPTGRSSGGAHRRPSAAPNPVPRRPRLEGAGGVSAETSAGGAQEIDTLTVAEGTEVRITLRDSLSTRTSAAGDTFRAEVAEPVYDGRRLALPAGAVITGRVTEVRESGGARERAVLHTGFLHVEVGDERYPFRAALVETNPVMSSRISTLERSAKIAAGALLGGLVGGYLTGGSGALAGAAVGGSAAAVWVMSTQDVDVVLPAGSGLRARITREIEVIR